MFKKIASLLLVLFLVACGGGGGSSGTSPFGQGSGSTGAGSGVGAGSGTGSATTEGALAMSLQLLDAAGASTSSVVAGQPVRAKAVLTRNGQPLANEIVQFTLDQPADIARLEPTSGSMLTDAAGTAIVSVASLGSATGAGTVRAASTIGASNISAGANFFSSGSTATAPASLTLSGLEVASTSVSAYGTTGVKVRVLQAGVPYTSAVSVNFTTSCAAGKATITATTTTQADGYAVGTFVDNGCAPTSDSTVTVTASISTDSKSASFLVKAPTTGSLRFLSVAPSDKSITLKGQGGNGRQENATVTFQLVDVAGNGVGNADVCFDVTTYIGGLNLDGFSPTNLPSTRGTAELCGADSLSVVRYVKRTNPDGTVVVQINSGNVPTPVRVRARTLYPVSAPATLESFSDSLSISTGLPMQRSFSLSVDKANIEGGDVDGEIATLTVRLADQFSNPVPDGTVVNFISSGAAVCTANNGSCKTANGACSCNVVSQARRPFDRRVVVTAYAVGLEDYNDTNGDNLYTSGEAFGDLGDAYVDADKDGAPGSATLNGDTDIPIPYQQNSVFKATGDGVRGTAHIRASTVIYLSASSGSGDPTVVMPKSQLSQERRLTSGGADDLEWFVAMRPKCPSTVEPPHATLQMLLDDGYGNPMAAGTTLAAVDASNNLSVGTFRSDVVLALPTRTPRPSVDFPNTPKFTPWTSTNAFGNVVTPHGVLVNGITDKCSGNATFGLEIASPRGPKVLAKVLYEGEARVRPDGTVRRGFDVRYRDRVNFTVFAAPGGVVRLAPTTLVAPQGVTATSVEVDWGDGNPPQAVALPMPSSLSHSYAPAFIGTSVLVTVTVTGSDGKLYSTASDPFPVQP